MNPILEIGTTGTFSPSTYVFGQTCHYQRCPLKPFLSRVIYFSGIITVLFFLMMTVELSVFFVDGSFIDNVFFSVSGAFS